MLTKREKMEALGHATWLTDHAADMRDVVNAALREDIKREARAAAGLQGVEWNADGYGIDKATGEACALREG